MCSTWQPVLLHMGTKVRMYLIKIGKIQCSPFITRLVILGPKEWITELGDNCIQIFHLRRYIVGNLVLPWRASGAIKRDFQTYIQRYTSPNEKFEYGYPHSNAPLQFCLKLKRCKPHKAARHPSISDVINDVKLFPTGISQDILSQIFDVIQSKVAL